MAAVDHINLQQARATRYGHNRQADVVRKSQELDVPQSAVHMADSEPQVLTGHSRYPGSLVAVPSATAVGVPNLKDRSMGDAYRRIVGNDGR